MAFPNYVVTRQVSVGGAYQLEDGTALDIEVLVTADRSLTYEATGFLFEAGHTIKTASNGGQVVFALPVTDQAGWRNEDGLLLDVSAEGSFTHTYRAQVTVGKGLTQRQFVIGPFVLPTGDGSPVDLDLVVPVGTSEATTVFVPDIWTAFVPEVRELAEQTHVDRVAAGTSAFNSAASAAAAQGSETAAAASAQSASQDAGVASTAATSASTSSGLASGYATTASGAATTATTRAGEATTAAGQTAADRTATAADRVQTGLDRTAAAGSATAAATSATAADTSKTAAETAAGVAQAATFAGVTVTTPPDYNTLTTPGIYVIESTAVGGANQATATSGVLEVTRVGSAGRFLQRFTPYLADPRMLYIRERAVNGTWSAWRAIATQRVNKPSGQPGVEIFTYDDVSSVERRLMIADMNMGAGDLDLILAPGVYSQTTNANATTANHYPVNGQGGIMEVLLFGGYAMQRFTLFSNARGFYSRKWNGSVWSAWVFTTNQRINQPSGQPGIEVFTWDDVNSRENALYPVQLDLGSTDLDIVKAAGVYQAGNGGNATLARHYPAAGMAGVLEVLEWNKGAGNVVQRYTPQPNDGTPQKLTGFWERAYRGTAWGDWVFFPRQRVDKTAGLAIYTWDDVGNREQLFYGDTGERDMTGAFTAGSILTTVPSYALLRRFGQLVTFTVGGFTKTAGTISFTGLIPLGFRPGAPLASASGHDSGGNLANAVAFKNGDFAMRGPQAVANGGLSMTWDTLDAWPAALPGAASSTVPAL